MPAILALLPLAIATGDHVTQALARPSFLLAKGDELRAIADIETSQIASVRPVEGVGRAARPAMEILAPGPRDPAADTSDRDGGGSWTR